MRYNWLLALLLLIPSVLISRSAVAQTVEQEIAILKAETEGLDMEIEVARRRLLHPNTQLISSGVEADRILSARLQRREEVLKRLSELNAPSADLALLELRAIHAEIKYCADQIQQEEDRYDAALADFDRRKKENNRSFLTQIGLRPQIYEVSFRAYEHYDQEGVRLLKARIAELTQKRDEVFARLRSGTAPCSDPLSE